MAGTFILGETKTRPGAYFNIQKTAENLTSSVINGVVAVIFKSDFGPLGKVVEIGKDENYENLYGTGLTTDTIRHALAGGARTIIACRLGSGGTAPTVTLVESGGSGDNALTITGKYAGSKDFTVTVRTKLSDATMKECIIYTGTTEFEKVEFEAGTGEAAACAEAINATTSFTATVASGKDDAILDIVSQKAFTAGTNPTITNADYSAAFGLVEAYEFNTICVDTTDTAIHTLLHNFVDRVFDVGLLTQAVVAENHDVALDTRRTHAAAFNDEKINYVLNAYVKEGETAIDGYQTAARIAGMISASDAGTSLTHSVVSGISELLEPLSNTDMITAEKKGCIVLSYNSEKQVWIDSAINTLVTPGSEQDEGWKKIRRTKCRYELIRRMNTVADNLIGKIDNDENGRATVVSQLQGIGDTMAEEGKIVSCEVYESTIYPPVGDSAWFNIDVVDKDSMEHIYLTYSFQFSTSV